MIDVARWLFMAEVLGLAFLPLTVWLLRSLPDRGYIFAKVLGLLLTVYVTWLIGNIAPVAGGVALPLAVVVLGGAGVWWLLGKAVLPDLRSRLLIIGIEEGLFLAAFVVWSLMRAFVFDPAIAHTEQPMDMAFLNATIRSVSYPPYDPWMSGHTINYYYLGYLMFGTLTKVSGVAPAIGYNLALSQIFALTVVGAYSLGYALTRRLSWALLAPVLVALVGNWHAAFVQLPAGHLPGNTTWWFWDSTRVVGAANDYTINEFPFFSLLLGDLHPHLMSLPVTLLALALCASVLFAESALALRRSAAALGRLFLAAVVIGSLFTINSWDFPTYLLIFGACAAANAYIVDQTQNWWKLPLLPVAGVALVSVVAFLPFYLHFHSLAHGIGRVYTHADPLEFLQIFGLFLLAAALLLGTLALLLQPADENEATETTDVPRGLAAERGSGNVSSVLLVITLAVLVLLAAALHLWVLLLVLGLGSAALGLLQRVTNTDEPNRSDTLALLLIATACFLIALTELIYVRDSFDGGASYRMNTVFKFYYQSWVLLGLAGAYGIFRGWQIVSRYFSRAYAACVIAVSALGIAAAAVYTVLAPQSAPRQAYASHTLDGSAWLQSAHPGDFAAIRWLDSHVTGHPVVLEAVGSAAHPDEYDPTFARIATFSGLPSVMGWEGHEIQWRPSDPEIMARVADVRSIYTTTSITSARALLRKYRVRYVVVGDTEREVYGANSVTLSKFKSFMHVAFQHAGTTIYTW